MRLRDVHMVPVSIHKLEDRLIGPRLIQCGECGRSFLSFHCDHYTTEIVSDWKDPQP